MGCATLLVCAQMEDGADMMVVSKQLGHKRLSCTIDQYGHLTSGMTRDVAARMDRLTGDPKV